jgi:hypothetical protein
LNVYLRSLALVERKREGKKVKGAEQFWIGAVILVLIGLCIAAVHTGHWDTVPAIVLGGVTCIISYAAYRFSREKVRLDLFEKRWAIYEKTLDFCSLVEREGTLKRTTENAEIIQKATEAAHASFRGIGWHQTRALFGPDIHRLFDELNREYTWLLSHSRPPAGEKARLDWANREHDALIFIGKAARDLPEAFRPYMYFGDIKSMKN